MIETKVVIDWFKNNFECDWLINLSDNETSGKTWQLNYWKNWSFLKPIISEEIIYIYIYIYIYMYVYIHIYIFSLCSQLFTENEDKKGKRIKSDIAREINT